MSIPDGHAITGWVNEVANLHPRIEFTFRRMSNAEWAEYVETIQGWSETKAQAFIDTLLSKRISKWDYKGDPAEEASISALPPRLHRRLWLIVAGHEGPDGIVGQDKSDADAEFNAAREAARSGRPLSKVREEMQRKNLPSA